jgi:hypothetical protein
MIIIGWKPSWAPCASNGLKPLFRCAGKLIGGQPPVLYSLQETSPGYRR